MISSQDYGWWVDNNANYLKGITIQNKKGEYSYRTKEHSKISGYKKICVVKCFYYWRKKKSKQQIRRNFE